MDWHVEYPGVTDCNTWGGYTFNQTLFPSPTDFMNYLANGTENVVGNRLNLILNVHGQTGILISAFVIS